MKSETPRLFTTYVPLLRTQWGTLVAEIVNDFGAKSPWSNEVATEFEAYLTNPGKFLRPLLVLFAYETYARKPVSTAYIRVALSLELLHIYLLIHDDIMDQSLLRRGGPALHKRFEKSHLDLELRGNSAHYGMSLALLVGDMVSNLAESIWTDSIDSQTIPSTLRSQFDQLKSEVYWGQFLDVRLSVDRKVPTLEAILQVMREKTGRYSIYRPMQIGVLSARCPEPTWLEPFALATGVAYQTTDDLLGTFGDQQKTGKSIDADLVERKITPLVHFAFEGADQSDLELLNRYYLQEDSVISPNTIKAILKKTGSDAKTRALARTYGNEAKSVLAQSNLDAQAKGLLEELISFILVRER